MAPKSGKDDLLSLCTASITLGNSIAVHMLDYLSVVRDPPTGFNRLAVEFIDTSRVVIPAKTGLQEAARSYSALPPEASKDLKDRFLQLYTAYTVLNQVVNKFNDGEKKQGFGKLGKGFRMMFADSEIEKLRLSLQQCREGLQRNPEMNKWALGENQIEPAAGIGYTALAAVLDKPDPTRGKALPSSPSSATISASPPELPMVPSSPMSMDRYAPSTMSSRMDMPPPGLPETSIYDRERVTGPSFSRESSNYTSGGYSNFSMRSSSMPLAADNLSENTAATSVAEMEDMMHQTELADRTPKQAVRIHVDPSKVPRWTPKQRGPISPQSRTALLSAVQQQNHKMAEQLLDSGVPADGTPERSLLSVAIVNHDFTTVRLLLLFGGDPEHQDKDGMTPLLSATQASFFDAAAILLKYGASGDYSAGPHNESPLARALTSGQTPFVELFLKHGADPASLMLNGNSPFIQSINKSVAVPLLELCLLYGCDPNHKNGRGETALFRAITAERLDIVRALLDGGANADLPGPKHMLWPSVHQPKILELVLERGANLRKAPGVLELATSINSLEAVNILIEHGVDVNAKKDGIFTPLCTSIRDDHEDIFDTLLAAGADCNEPSAEWPIWKTITHHRPHLLPRVLSHGGKVDHPKGVVEMAVSCKEMEGLKILLNAGTDPNGRGASGNTPLATAILTGQMDMLDILLEFKADPAMRGAREFPISLAIKNPEILAKLLPHIPTHKIIKGALEQAVVAGQLESVKLLLAKGVSVEEKNGGVFSPLTTSIREDKKEIFRYLIDEAGADVNEPGEHLPIIKSIRRHRENDLSYIEYLISKGADVNLMHRGWNAVLQAVDNGDTQILKLLAEKGRPDLTARDENGQTVAEMIEERGLIEEEKILLGGRTPSPKMTEAMSNLRDFVKQK